MLGWAPAQLLSPYSEVMHSSRPAGVTAIDAANGLSPASCSFFQPQDIGQEARTSSRSGERRWVLPGLELTATDPSGRTARDAPSRSGMTDGLPPGNACPNTAVAVGWPLAS